MWTSHESAPAPPGPKDENGVGMVAVTEQGGGVRDRGHGGAQGGCAVQEAEEGDAVAVGLLAPGAHPIAQGATIVWVCVNASLSCCLLHAGGTVASS